MESFVSELAHMRERTTSPRVPPDRSSIATTIAIVAGAWPKAAPVDPNARYTGRRGLSREYVSGLSVGVMSAVMVLPWIWILPYSWMTNGRLASDYFIRARRLDGLFRKNGVQLHWAVRWMVFLSWGSSFLLLVNLVPRNLRLVVDVGMSKGTLAMAMAGLEYAVSDSPLGREYLVLISQLGFTLGYGIAAVLMFRPIWLVTQMSRCLSLALDILLDAIAEYGLFGTRWDTTILLYRPLPMRQLWWPALKIGLPFAIFAVTAWKVTEDETMFKKLMRDLGTELRKTLRTKVSPKVDVALEYTDEAMAFLSCGLPSAIGAAFGYIHQIFQDKDPGWYRYQRLQPGQIRVLTLKRSLPGVIRADLFVTSSRDAQYEAISYRWRDQTVTTTLMIDGRRLMIPQAAYAAILARRSVWRDRTIWIDAVCINQNDEVEKAHQVLMMQEIYRDSIRVLLMPDAADWRSRLTLDLIYQHGFEPEPAPADQQLSELEEVIQHGMPIDGNQWRQMGRLLAREYWMRAWVVQEVASGQTVEVYLGGLYVPWNIFRIASLMLQRPGKILLLQRNAGTDFEAEKMQFQAILVMHQLRRGPDNAEGAPFYRPPDELTRLETLLYFSVKFEASDERDKVFAFNSLASDVDSSRDELIRPDYTKSVEQVFEDCGRHLFLHPDNPSINLLCYAGHGFPASRKTRLSWTPRFTQQNYIPFTNLILRNARFSASATSKPYAILRDSCEGQDILSVHGTVCDRVRILSPESLHPVERPHDNTRTIAEYLIKWVQSAICAASGPVAMGSRLEQCLIAEGDTNITRKVLERWLDTVTKTFAAQTDEKEETRTSELLASNDELLFGMYIYEACCGRRFGVTQEGRYCLVPPLTEPGDIVVVFFGAQTPYVIRGVSSGGTVRYRLVGEAYVQGIMHGEVISASTQSQGFDLV